MANLACTPKIVRPHGHKFRLFIDILFDGHGQMMSENPECMMCWKLRRSLDDDSLKSNPHTSPILKLPADIPSVKKASKTGSIKQLEMEVQSGAVTQVTSTCSSPSSILCQRPTTSVGSRNIAEPILRSVTTLHVVPSWDILIRSTPSVLSVISLASRYARIVKSWRMAMIARRRQGIAASLFPTIRRAAQTVARFSTKCATLMGAMTSNEYYTIEQYAEANRLFRYDCGYLLCLECEEAFYSCHRGVACLGEGPDIDTDGQLMELSEEEAQARHDIFVKKLKMARRYCLIPEHLKHTHLAFSGEGCWQYDLESDGWTPVKKPSSSM